MFLKTKFVFAGAREPNIFIFLQKSFHQQRKVPIHFKIINPTSSPYNSQILFSLGINLTVCFHKKKKSMHQISRQLYKPCEVLLYFYFLTCQLKMHRKHWAGNINLNLVKHYCIFIFQHVNSKCIENNEQVIST